MPTRTLIASGLAGAVGTFDTIPGAGDDLLLTGAFNVTMDQALTYGTITLDALYSGTATQGAVDFGYSDFSMAAGTWTGAATANKQTSSGDWTKTGGTCTNYVLYLVMTGAGKTLTSNSLLNLWKLQCSGSITVNSNIHFESDGGRPGWTLVVDSGKSCTVSSGKYLEIAWYNIAGTYSNLGYIDGAGILRIQLYDASKTMTFGDVRCAFQLTLNAAADRVLTLGASAILGSTVTITGGGANTMTLNLAGYSLTSTSATVSTRGILSSSVAGARIDTVALVVAANGTLDMTNIEWARTASYSNAGTFIGNTWRIVYTVTPIAPFVRLYKRFQKIYYKDADSS